MREKVEYPTNSGNYILTPDTYDTMEDVPGHKSESA